MPAGSAIGPIFPANSVLPWSSLKKRYQTDHSLNPFWRLLSVVLCNDIAALPCEEQLQQLQQLLSHRIGLRDVFALRERESSLETAIRRAQANDFAMLKEQCPDLLRICFNGKTSGKVTPQFANAGFETLVRPLLARQCAASFEQKLALWRNIIL